MMDAGLLAEVDLAVSHIIDEDYKTESISSLGGGSINEAMRICSEKNCFFIKLNQASLIDMFEAEFDGLHEIDSSGTIRVPKPMCYGVAGGRSYIVMEFIQLTSGKRRSSVHLGEQLASMHRCSTENFGWRRDNTIGSTPQDNTMTNNWVDFYGQCRLQPQLQLADRNGYGGELQRLGENLLATLDTFFESYQPMPSLLHGDLWSGNYAFSSSGEPVIFDPATYYGDRECDIAMTELFGGFSADFYNSYNEFYPLDEGYARRKDLYNLYHVLNHVNLFGGGYHSQAISLMRNLLH